MSSSIRQALAWLAVALIAASTTNTLAATINYGDFSDIPPGWVMYQDVRESSVTDPTPPPHYNAPTITGNALSFEPTDFGAESSGGGADVFDGQLNFRVEAPQVGNQVAGGVNSLVLSESGDFTLFGSGTSVTSVAAGIFAEVRITEVDGVTLGSPLTVVGSTQFSADLASSPGLNQPWGNTLFVDFSPAFMNAGLQPKYGATAMSVKINDTLGAVSEPSSIALIVKKSFDVDLGGKPNPDYMVPEPNSALLLGALLGLGALLRRVA